MYSTEFNTPGMPIEGTVLKIARGTPLPHGDSSVLTPWDEIVRAYRTHRMLTGRFIGIESHNGTDIAVIQYKGSRVVIPIMHMLFLDRREEESQASYYVRVQKRLRYMLGAEIDFYVKGLDEAEHCAVASRTEAMLKKRLRAYLVPGETGRPRICVNTYAEARVVAVFDHAIRIEVFGVEHAIFGRNLAWQWLRSAYDAFAVGQVLVARIDEIDYGSAGTLDTIGQELLSDEDLQSLRVVADIKAATPNAPALALAGCIPQSHYAGRIVEISNGNIYLQLANGANALAYDCRDWRAPSLGDDVDFVVIRIKKKDCCAVGIITHIIRKNS